MTATHAIEVKGLVKTYEKLTAIDGISFDVNNKEVFSFLGPNGAGKTTTVEILECLRDPTAGEAYVLGYDVRKHDGQEAIKKKIGVLPQDFNALDWLTVFENIEYFRKIYGSRADSMYLLKLVGMDERANQRYKTLSGGMKQRLGIAISLVNDPEIIFLDEPTAGLDPQARRDTWELIRKLRDEGKTTFLTTHYMEEAQALSDTVMLIVEGKIVARGSPDQLIDEYGGKKSIVVRNASSGIDNHNLITLFDGMRAKVAQNGDVIVPFTDNSDLTRVISILEKENAKMAEIELRSPNLEDVFLSLTGKRITSEGSVG